METIAEPVAPFRPLRYAGAAVLTLISAACLTLSYLHEGLLGRVLRIGIGLGLPWVIASLFTRSRYWVRLGLSYLGVVVTGIVLILIWPFVSLFLMDSALM